MENIKDQRTYNRYTVSKVSVIINRHTSGKELLKPLSVNCTDFSISGMTIISEHKFELRDNLLLKFIINNSKKDSLSGIIGSVVNIRIEREKVYRYGIKYDLSSNEFLKSPRVKDFLEKTANLLKKNPFYRVDISNYEPQVRELSFKVHLIFLITTTHNKSLFNEKFDYLDKLSITETEELVEFKSIYVQNEEELRQIIGKHVNNNTSSRIIIVSDILTCENDDGGYSPSELTKQIMTLFINSPTHYLGLVALINGKQCRTRDIDTVADARNLTSEELKKLIVKVACGLWLKSPINKSVSLQEKDVIKVQMVNSLEELQECFALRYKVYNALGYLEEEISSSTSKIEIDSFDIQSIHLSATNHTTKKVIGTIRLVLLTNIYPITDVMKSLKRTADKYTEWTEAIAKRADNVFISKLNNQYSLPFPILVNSNFQNQWPDFLDKYRIQDSGELSRLVVSPHYRGVGVSRLLLRASIAIALYLKKRHLLLECIPGHVSMYRKFGFKSLEKHHCRAQELDQTAVGMTLSLDNTPFNEVFSLAEEDIKKIWKEKRKPNYLFESSFLCLCHINSCWKKPGYTYLEKDICSLNKASI